MRATICGHANRPGEGTLCHDSYLFVVVVFEACVKAAVPMVYKSFEIIVAEFDWVFHPLYAEVIGRQACPSV